MTANPDLQYRRKTKSELIYLRALPDVEPATSTGRVAWIWPEIEAALATGKKLREVFDAARADGLDIPYPQFRVYVSRLRSRQRLKLVSELRPLTAGDSPATLTPEPQVQSDPFRNLREQREKKQSTGFNYDPFSNQKQLID